MSETGLKYNNSGGGTARIEIDSAHLARNEWLLHCPHFAAKEFKRVS